jgi:hypothetical protein
VFPDGIGHPLCADLENGLLAPDFGHQFLQLVDWVQWVSGFSQ